jgi:DNA-binding MarR family transcriptional regulator
MCSNFAVSPRTGAAWRRAKYVVLGYIGENKARLGKMTADTVDDADYQALAAFRYALRRFLRYSNEAAAELGLETQQYQALLAIRARGADRPMTTGELAEEMQVRPNSAAGMAKRLEERRLIARHRGKQDRRQVLLTLTETGRQTLKRLAAAHKSELKKAMPAFDILMQQFSDEE